MGFARTPDLADQCRQGTLNIPEAKRDLKKRERQKAREEAAAQPVPQVVGVGKASDLGELGVAVRPGGTRIYVTNRGDKTVSVINTTTNTVTATIAVGHGPLAFGQF